MKLNEETLFATSVGLFLSYICRALVAFEYSTYGMQVTYKYDAGRGWFGSR